MQRIHADLLIPGHGAPIDGGVVVMDQGRITYAGPAADAPPHRDADVVEAAVVMPGMWDCHAHFTGTDSLDPLRWALEPTAAAGARSAVDARSALRAGSPASVSSAGSVCTSPARSMTAP
jgi:imidazolonepropionase-like amidohydrolase